jgi:ParB-like chromosome segregation protein Spo0J
VTVPDSLKQLVIPLEGLQPYSRNPRRGDVDLIAASLTTNGQYRPIVVNSRTQQILAGNHTFYAAQQLGWTEIAATFVDVDEHQAARIVLADNRTADQGDYDQATLAALLADVAVDEQGLAGTGYTDADLTALLATMKEPEPPAEFPGFDDETIVTEHKCPRCGYEYSGKGG